MEPLAKLLGPFVGKILRDRLQEEAPRILSDLTGPNGFDTAFDIVVNIWHGQEADPDWWRLPLGRLCAAALEGQATDESVTQKQAAAMLGVTRGTVAQLVARGTLARHADGGVSKAAVFARILKS